MILVTHEADSRFIVKRVGDGDRGACSVGWGWKNGVREHLKCRQKIWFAAALVDGNPVKPGAFHPRLVEEACGDMAAADVEDQDVIFRNGSQAPLAGNDIRHATMFFAR